MEGWRYTQFPFLFIEARSAGKDVDAVARFVGTYTTST